MTYYPIPLILLLACRVDSIHFLSLKCYTVASSMYKVQNSGEG